MFDVVGNKLIVWVITELKFSKIQTNYNIFLIFKHFPWKKKEQIIKCKIYIKKQLFLCSCISFAYQSLILCVKNKDYLSSKYLMTWNHVVVINLLNIFITFEINNIILKQINHMIWNRREINICYIRAFIRCMWNLIKII